MARFPHIPGEASISVSARKATEAFLEEEGPMGRLARLLDSGKPLSSASIDQLEGLLRLGSLSDPAKRRVRDLLQGKKRSADVQQTLYPGRPAASPEQIEGMRANKGRTNIYGRLDYNKE